MSNNWITSVYNLCIITAFIEHTHVKTEDICVTGVKDVDSFNEQFVQLLTEAGELRIEGADLHITKLNLDEGQVMLEGEISALEYAEGEERGSLLGRIFR